MIEIKNLTKTYDGKKVLDNLSLCLPDKGFAALRGNSGAGKTTFIRILLGLEKADFGSIVFITCTNESDPSEITYKKDNKINRPMISAVFQDDILLENETAVDNVLIVCEKSLGKKEAAERSAAILTELGLGSDLDTPVKKLSGGMKRRVAIARSLAVDCGIYIMDEPIKGLERNLHCQVIDVIRKYTCGKLLIMSSHNEYDIADADMFIDF